MHLSSTLGETNHDKYCKQVKKGTRLESREVGQLHYNIITPLSMTNNLPINVHYSTPWL